MPVFFPPARVEAAPREIYYLQIVRSLFSVK